MSKPWYEVLGIAENASKTKIKSAHREQVKKWHPDVNPNNLTEATKRTQEINRAYDEALKSSRLKQTGDDQQTDEQKRRKQEEKYKQNEAARRAAEEEKHKHFKDIFHVAKDGTIENVRYCVEKRGFANKQNDYGNTPLFFAAGYNPNIEVVEYLVSRWGGVNTKNNRGMTPLHLAALKNSNVKVLKYLVSKNADFNAKDNKGKIPLDYADTEEKQRFLRAVEAARRKREAERQAAREAWSKTNTIFVVAAKGTTEDLRYFLEVKKVHVNARDQYGKTALHWAAEYNCVSVLQYLVSQGTDVNAKSNQGWTPLIYARNEENIHFLRASERDSRQAAEETRRKQEAKRKHDRDETIRKAGKVNPGYRSDHPHVFSAAKTGTVVDLHYFLEQCIDVNSTDEHGDTLLHLAAMYGNESVVEYLIDRKANINAVNMNGKTPLDIVVSSNMLQILWKAGGKSGQYVKTKRKTATETRRKREETEHSPLKRAVERARRKRNEAERQTTAKEATHTKAKNSSKEPLKGGLEGDAGQSAGGEKFGLRW